MPTLVSPGQSPFGDAPEPVALRRLILREDMKTAIAPRRDREAGSHVAQSLRATPATADLPRAAGRPVEPSRPCPGLGRPCRPGGRGDTPDGVSRPGEVANDGGGAGRGNPRYRSAPCPVRARRGEPRQRKGGAQRLARPLPVRREGLRRRRLCRGGSWIQRGTGRMSPSRSSGACPSRRASSCSAEGSSSAALSGS